MRKDLAAKESSHAVLAEQVASKDQLLKGLTGELNGERSVIERQQREIETLRSHIEAKQIQIAALSEQTASKGQTEQALMAARAELDEVRETLAAKESRIAVLEKQSEAHRQLSRP